MDAHQYKERMASKPDATGHDAVNFIPVDGGYKRVGYKSFLGLIWTLFLANKGCIAHDCKARYEFVLPIKWF